MSVKKGVARPLLMFAVLAVAYFLVYFHRTTGGAVSDTLQDFFDVGTVSVALLASAYLYAYTLMMIPSGILTDNLGPRKTATIFIILIAVGSIFSSYASSSGTGKPSSNLKGSGYSRNSRTQEISKLSL